jgi:hypothetical protein
MVLKTLKNEFIFLTLASFASLAAFALGGLVYGSVARDI